MWNTLTTERRLSCHTRLTQHTSLTRSVSSLSVAGNNRKAPSSDAPGSGSSSGVLSDSDSSVAVQGRSWHYCAVNGRLYSHGDMFSTNFTEQRTDRCELCVCNVSQLCYPCESSFTVAYESHSCVIYLSISIKLSLCESFVVLFTWVIPSAAFMLFTWVIPSEAFMLFTWVIPYN